MFVHILNYVPYVIGLILNIFAETHSQYMKAIQNKEERYSGNQTFDCENQENQSPPENLVLIPLDGIPHCD